MKQKKKKRKHRKTMKKILMGTMVVVTLLPMFTGLLPKQQTTTLDPKLAQAFLDAKRQNDEEAALPEIAGRYEVLDVPDDSSLTVLYDGNTEVVKLIGIARNEESKEHLQQLLSDNYVDLEFDAVQRDEEGNLLAYVYLEDGRFINQELLLNGYAVLDEASENTRYEEVLYAAQEDAKTRKVGVWEDTETEATQE